MSDFMIQSIADRSIPSRAHERVQKSSGGFSDVVKQAIKKVNDMKVEADHSVEQLAKGQAGIHETMIALQKADISLRLLLQVRNKAMDAYREIMRMGF
jgi:flagellar hook-basal body complex protein FliE